MIFEELLTKKNCSVTEHFLLKKTQKKQDCQWKLTNTFLTKRDYYLYPT